MHSRRSFLSPKDFFLQQPFLRRESQDSNDTHPVVVLTALPFNHLGVWAYIAIGFIILLSSMVLCYITYSCCHSAWQRQYYNSESRPNKGREIVSLDSIKLSGMSPPNEVVQNRRSRWTKVSAAKAWFKRSENAGTKSGNLRGIMPTPSSVSNGLSRAYIQSTETKRFPIPQRVLNVAGSHSLYNIRPPPSFSSMSDKECIQKQYAASYQPPSSPSPSYTSNPSVPPLATEPIHEVPGRLRPHRLHGTTAHNVNKPSKTLERHAQFDSNNIRYATPPSPFMTRDESIWNEPKLSPIGGAIISPTIPPSSAVESIPVPPIILSATEHRSPALPVLASPRKTRLLSPPLNPRAPDDYILGQLVIDTKNPISRPVHLHAHQGR